MKKRILFAIRIWIVLVFTLTLLLPAGDVYATSTSGTGGVTMSGSTVTGYTGTGGNVAIPDTATSIADGAFSGKSNITSVIIPSSVTSIGSNAFANCTGLTSITVPGSVTTLGTGVFSGCTKLSSVSLQASVSAIPNSMFSGCSALTSIAISASISNIGPSAFANCKSLSSMALPAGVTTIGSGAFSGCTALTGVSIPASTTSIATDAFNGCSSLSTINVAAGNGTYASDGGCLYNASFTKLLVCPPAKSSIALNSAVKIIGSGAFNGCSRITSISLPSGATTIEAGAFNGSGITSITIPKSVTSIGSQSWAIDIIYGYLNSTAESYALDNGYVFYPLDGDGSTGDSDDESEEITTGNANYEDLSGDDEDISTSGSGSSGDSGNSDPSPTVKPNSNPTTQGSGAYSSTTSDVHQMDNTPKTADGLDPKLLICLALVLIGCAFFILGKRKSA